MIKIIILLFLCIQLLHAEQTTINRNNKECAMIAVIGEHSHSSEKEIMSFLVFLHQNTNDTCKAWNTKLPSGRYRFDARYKQEKIKTQIKYYAKTEKKGENKNILKVKKMINAFYNKNYNILEYDKYKLYSNYMTLELACSKKPPYYIIWYMTNYEVVDKTIYLSLNPGDKKLRNTKPYINFYMKNCITKQNKTTIKE